MCDVGRMWQGLHIWVLGAMYAMFERLDALGPDLREGAKDPDTEAL